jgi:hypothetical protein
MNKQFLKDSIGWGFLLWLIGYVLGIVFFFIMPPTMIGWVVMPIGILITVWVLLKMVKGNTFSYYAKLAVVWTLIAIAFDYLFIVQLFKPSDGYYKLDVFLYYALTFIIPLIVGWWKRARATSGI